MVTKKAKKAADLFTEKKLLVWLRSAMRSASRRYPPIFEALAAAKEPYVGENARQKFCYRCADCQKTFPAKEVAVDHIVDCGSLTSWNDIQGFMQRLFCPREGLQVLCDECHDIKTLMSKNGLTKSEAIARKRIISFVRNNSATEIKEFLLNRGYNEKDISNQKKRENCLENELIKNKTLFM